MKERIAELLGWSLADVNSFSLLTLRELVRPLSPKLAHELDAVIRGGSHIIGERPLP
jgi:hypothetical protein